MAKSVIRAGCDVDHFHRGHTPLMMASIRGHDDVVKELILAGCKVDLWSSRCTVGWFGFITKTASAWSAFVLWVVMVLQFVMVENNLLVSMVCYCLLLLVMGLQFLSKDSFKISQGLRMKARAKYMALVGIVPLAAALFWRVVALQLLLFRSVTVLVMVMTVTLLMEMTMVEDVAVTRLGTQAHVVAGAGAVALTVVLTLTDTVTAVAGAWAWWETTAGAEEETVFVVPDMVATVVAFAMMLTMAGPGALPFTVTIIVTGAVITASIVGLASWDTGLKLVGVPAPLLLSVILLFALPPVGAIKRMITLPTTGMTALHYAAWYNHITCGAYLVEAGANVQADNKYFRTPLHICSRKFRAAVQQAQSHPPKHVIAVIGNTEYSKSTLIAALQSESRTVFQNFIHMCAQVHNITQRTAGIETVPFSSAKYGKVLFYDFAGQADYHGPHQPFLEAMLSKPGVTVTVLLLVKVSEGRDVIIQQLRRWLQPLALARTPSTPHVIVVGSFLDQAKSKNVAANVQRLQGCIESVQNEYPFLKVQKLFLLDCREPESAGINELRNYLQETKPPHSTSRALYNVHWVMTQLQKAFSGPSLQLNAFSVWLQDIARDLPTHLPSAEDVCQDLSAAGYILFLGNKQDLSQSWLVLDLQTILHNVYGTLFSPGRAVVNQFGLLHCTDLSELFPNLDPTMIQEVLITLEFCITADPLLLKEEMTEQDEVEGWLYFPALVSAEAGEVFEQDQQSFHWACWQLESDNYVILAHLLQGILLHLAFMSSLRRSCHAV